MDFFEYNEQINTWVKEVLNSRGVSAERTLKYCDKLEQYARDTNDAKILGFADYYRGETYYVLNDGEKLFYYITNAISYLDQSEQWSLVARAYNIMGITSYNRGNAPISMDYYLTGLNYCKKYQMPELESIINLNLGTLYMNCNQYREAQQYFETVYAYVSKHPELEVYMTCMTCIYVNLGRCYMVHGKLEKTQKYLERLCEECKPYFEPVDELYVLCFKARYYHQAGKQTLRDECIQKIHEQMNEDIAIMDIFDDFYDFCQLLLEIKQEQVLWDTITILEELSKQAKIINLQRKIISLKIRYYRIAKDNAGYLQASGLYYELTEVMEHENQYMINNMLQVRESLEKANERRRSVEEANKNLVEKSETDPLTGLSNRYRLNDYTEKIFECCLKEQKTLAIEILDIDYFKQYNDNYGHQAGDECICAIADVLKKIQSEHIFCARYGGDEFIIIYDGMSKDEVQQMSSDLRSSILDLKIEHLYSEAMPIVTISQGICVGTPKEENKSWDFLHNADAMLYRVKKESRNSICIGTN